MRPPKEQSRWNNLWRVVKRTYKDAGGNSVVVYDAEYCSENSASGWTRSEVFSDKEAAVDHCDTKYNNDLRFYGGFGTKEVVVR